MLKLEHESLLKNEQLRILRAILLQSSILYKLNSNKRILENENFVGKIATNTKVIFKSLSGFRAMKYIYDGILVGNIVFFKIMECGETTFIQKLDINKLFVKLKTVQRISKIQPLTNRERQIKSCFSTEVYFRYLNKVSKFEKILSYQQRQKVQNEKFDIVQDVNNDDDNIFGKKKKKTKTNGQSHCHD